MPVGVSSILLSCHHPNTRRFLPLTRSGSPTVSISQGLDRAAALVVSPGQQFRQPGAKLVNVFPRPSVRRFAVAEQPCQCSPVGTANDNFTPKRRTVSCKLGGKSSNREMST